MNRPQILNNQTNSLPAIRIRHAGPEDEDVLVGFSAALAWETEGRKLDLVTLVKGTRALLADSERGVFILAEHDEGELRSPVGQLMITYEWSDWRNGMFWWVQSVYVDPAWRRKGIYRAMHRHVLTKAKADPAVCGIRLYVDHNNRAAQNVYQQVGLAPSGYWVYEQDFVLGAQLSSKPDREPKERS